MRPGHGGDGGKGALENQAADLPILDQVDRDRAAEGASEDHRAPLRDSDVVDQVGEPGARVGVDAGFIGPAFGKPVAAVVEKQHVAAELHQRGGVGQAVGGVAGVSVQEEDRPGGAGVRQEEGVDADAVLRHDANVLPRDAELLRPEVHARLRVEDHAVDDPVPHEDEEYHTEERRELTLFQRRTPPF